MNTRPVLGCIADDFTGATDLANNLVRAGMRTVQTIGVPNDDSQLIDTHAVVVALKSRTIAAADAVAQSLAALAWLRSVGVAQIYFKYCSTFDSTAQGNIGPVIDALLDGLHGPGCGFTVACPAFPENQRTVFHGHLFVGDVLLSDSGMRTHPLTPMTDANLLRVLQAQTRRKVGLLAHETVRLGWQAIAAGCAALQEQGVGVAVVDAISTADLMEIGRALATVPLVTASSGLALGLPQNWNNLLPQDGADQMPPAMGARAVLSGSCSATSLAQIAHFKQLGHPAFAVDPLAIAAGEDVCAQALAWAKPWLATAPVLIYASAAPDSVRSTQAQLGVARASALVEETLAQIATGLFDLGVQQWVVAGGETSGAIVQALGVQRLRIGPQIDPGVPWTVTQAARWPDKCLHLALKSGNFGAQDFFSKAFTQLEPR